MIRNYRLENLNCAHCAAKMEDGVRKLEGVNEATVNFMTMKLIVDFEETVKDSINDEVKKIINKVDGNVCVRRI